MKKYLILLFVALATAFQACDNNDDLWDAIDDLKSRVQALETQVDALNGNIEALQTLYNGATISEVKETDGTYVITLTDGNSITLVQGSEAEAVIPIVSIDNNGNWQVSTDGGKTFTSLGVKAEAEDGVTPMFRIDEATGYWQVSYDGGKNYSNVLNTSNQPISAVGDGTITDRFFDEVIVNGDNLYIKLLDGTELEIPILPDFLCKIIVESEGVQMFDSGLTRRFDVQMRGVESTIVTAPDGWTARLTEPADEMATLIVTAPETVILESRATANSSQDVAILATTGKYSCISKIQVECTGAEAEAPTISVANSTTLLPTESTLTFDVTLSLNADGWKYICQKSDVVEIPNAEKILADGISVSGTSVTVEGLEDNTSYTIYVVAYTGDLVSEVASATNTTLEFVSTEVDYYQDYLDGKSITIGTQNISLVTHPSAELFTAENISELTAARLQTGGLIFIDNAEPLSFTVEGTSANVGRTTPLVLIGRYKEREQAKISVSDMRCNRDVAILNMHLIGTTDNTFTSTNAQTLNPNLTLVDCTLEVKRYFIYDNNKDWSFNDILIDNSLIIYPAGASNQPAIYSITTTAKTGGYPMNSIKLTNNVFYATAPTQAYIIQCGNSAQYDTKQLRIEVTGNTFFNIYQPNVLIRAYILSSLNVSRNVGYYTGVSAKNYLTAVYDKDNFPAASATVSYNYLYTDPVIDGTNFWSARHTGSYQATSNQIGEGLEVPFSKMDVSKGYFPINTSVVTTGAGATYDTKLWTTFE